MTERVVVTGMGAVTPLGNSVDEFLTGLFAGQVGIKPITKFDATPTGITVAGEVKDFQPEERIEKKLAKRLDLFSVYGLYS
ncbi:MAG: beta-ketoacyl-[acyl-carrier-protein] synthase II, partial [Lactiplantibacillus plantarum]|nr:beta-ketoacyl-[acyl-carrier-protein] synthase II [Lactiplantibacillus plantarum]